MYFGTKSYLKSNHYHTPKHPLKLTSGMHPEAYIGVIFKVKACESIAS